MSYAALISLVLGSVFGALLPSAAAASTQISPKPNFSATLRPQRQTFVIDVQFHNPTSKSVKLGYGDCSFSYVLSVGSKRFTFPLHEPFALPKVCTAKLNAPSVATQSSKTLFSVPVSEPLARTLKAARVKFSGEFHFKYALVGQPLIVHVYKTP